MEQPLSALIQGPDSEDLTLTAADGSNPTFTRGHWDTGESTHQTEEGYRQRTINPHVTLPASVAKAYGEGDKVIRIKTATTHTIIDSDTDEHLTRIRLTT